MSHAAIRLASLVVFSLAVLAFGAVGSQTPTTQALPLQQPTSEPIGDLIPCDPVMSRTIDPQIFKVGDETTVETRYDFKCTGKARKINFFLVVENSGQLRQGRGGVEALDNVVEGAQHFVNQVDYANGSKGGLVLYAAARTIRLTLQGGDEGRSNLIQALHAISIEPIGNSAGAGGAIRDATGLLPTGVQSDAKNIMIIVDAGAQEVPGGEIVDRYTACNAARQAGVTMAVVSFPAAQRRMASCASSGYMYQVSNDAGGNVKEIFTKMAESMLRGKLIDAVEYGDLLQDGFMLVPGSSYPREPDSSWQSQYFWNTGRVAPQTIRYRVLATQDLYITGQTRKLSEAAELLFTYQDGTDARVRLPNPDICVYRNDPSECAGKIPTETPVPTTAAPPSDTPDAPTPTDTPGSQPPTDTPGPPPTDTPEPPTDTPGPPPTDTAEPPSDTPVAPTEPTGFTIFLPRASKHGM